MNEEYPEELSRQARWGVMLGVFVLIIGLLFGPSATVSKEDFSDLKKQVDEISKNLAATQTKVNGYEASLNEVKTKVGGLDPKVAAIQDQMAKLFDEVKARMDSLAQELNQKVDSQNSALSEVGKTLSHLEATVSEKSQVSVLFEDAQLDGAGKPTCPQSYLAAQLLNEKDAALLRQMGIDKNGDGIVCILPALVVPIGLTQVGEPHN